MKSGCIQGVKVKYATPMWRRPPGEGNPMFPCFLTAEQIAAQQKPESPWSRIREWFAAMFAP
jgi:hypothetical protein